MVAGYRRLLKHAMARPAGIKLLIIFFAFGAVASAVTMVLLLFPGTGLDSIWRLNPNAHQTFTDIGRWAMLLMLTLALGAHLRRLVSRAERAGVDRWRL